MKTYFQLSICIVLGLFLNFQGIAQNQAHPIPGDLLVRCLPGQSIEKIVHDLQKIDGQVSHLHIHRLLSEHMNIWQLRFDPNISQEKMLQIVQKHPAVWAAQNNRWIQKRATVPNDPSFGLQWQYINNGGSGGVVDADIDAELAWDISTGGLSALGDTIVVCIIDDGLDLSHQDMAPNRWYNWNEIPNNGIDDDGNGFIDDFRGWDADANNDDITGGTGGGTHGTPVAGIVGAKGNNGIGVTGVNWDVKLMIVVGGGDEAQAIAAYSYPLAMRKLYNQTGGQRGAFVVATNASWGIDGAQASSAPLWCAMYDTLGAYGVLSAGATTNSNTNVDVQGDLPTQCPSDYLLSVTNMTRADVKVSSAGYGAVSIDLGAPGEGTYTVASGNGYGAFGGTSGATPHVAGAIGLIYSAPCPRLAYLAKTDPAAAAAMVRGFVLGGVDTIPSLANITVTGGRLNLHKSMLLAMASGCQLSGCYQPFGLNASAVLDSGATIRWRKVGDASLGYFFRYREIGSSTWITTTASDTFQVLTGLIPCTRYEAQVAANCDTTVGGYSTIFIFKTANCCLAPSVINVSNIASTSAQVSWASDPNVLSYTLEYRKVGAPAWTSVTITNPSFSFVGLDSCADYEFAIISTCNVNINNEYSNIIRFRTLGCGNCEDVAYCISGGDDSSYEWISNVTIGSINNTSGSNGGYNAFTQLSTLLQRGQSHPISLSLDVAPSPTANWRWKVWIDFNNNGNFTDPGEEVYSSNAITTLNFTTNASLNIPAAVQLGSTRMRVAMKWGNAQATPCTTFNYGEVEDYCVEIIESSAATINQHSNNQLWVYPNPIGEKIQLELLLEKENQATSILLTDAMGRVLQSRMVDLGAGRTGLNFSAEELPRGIYFVYVQLSNGEQLIKKLLK